MPSTQTPLLARANVRAAFRSRTQNFRVITTQPLRGHNNTKILQARVLSRGNEARGVRREAGTGLDKQSSVSEDSRLVQQRPVKKRKQFLTFSLRALFLGQERSGVKGSRSQQFLFTFSFFHAAVIVSETRAAMSRFRKIRTRKVGSRAGRALARRHRRRWSARSSLAPFPRCLGGT